MALGAKSANRRALPRSRGANIHLLPFWRSRSGVAAIEFAFLMPVFLILFVGIVDLGMMLVQDYRLDQAVAAGEEYAAVNGSSVNSTNGASLASSIATAVENANGTAWANDVVVVNNGPSVTVASGTATSGGTASNADSCYCPTGSPPNWTWGSAATCGSSCSGGSTAGKFVTITATASYTPLLGLYRFINSGTLRQSAVVQTQ
ncbi:MAG TPA: TadE/TadG family type IV pilus assembly protein [Rhizomicrobium sp.]|nr:TadE/TadG family type IV pilus assembly protein [Rhizomicrobium sp.]